jgi:NinB protein
MTDRRIIRLVPASRQAAIEAVRNAPDEYVVTIAPPTRKVVQNSKMWAMLSDLAKQVQWYGLQLSAEDWKDVLTASLRKELRTVPNVDGTGLVILGMRTSQMSVGKMADLIEYLYAFGASKDVKWSEPDERTGEK